MVLWEITLGTAYFLGLRRTYRLALKIQRRLISPKHPKIRQFAHRRTRAVFDVAIKVHKSIQERDIEVGRNLGNRILRWLDRMKPEAQIRGPLEKPPTSASMMNKVNSSHLKTPGSSQITRNQESDRHLFSTMTNMWSKPLPPITMMMRSRKPSGMINQYRHLCMNVPQPLRSNYSAGAFGGVIRKDIMQWMLQK
ncbi:PREDICTED: uncharacterized protein LOC103336850 [Prunus mume]|uniref:Uncharacterized protein LOC103336850 n=1 Tax=Prunus mume TaxID=102107 RepID=A0ABM0PDU7_PRUMU|nr:PREDICTED: uncharacterized protein LOC103336850 [Prunus mume]